MIEDVNRAATIVADHLCGAISDPIIRLEPRELGNVWVERIEEILARAVSRNSEAIANPHHS
ncbi:MAG: XamI family restriction endonuclease [Coleofasciculus sp. B1-GNL1-01]|uniref:XamI family restriction endonuclease n=1 Tax=Coleofasciculus sp. B1-GNL1-01 TaxID=3068484 RepID=UPI0032FBA5F5